MKQSSPVVILGGGIGGLACAVALLRRGLPSVIYERAPALEEVGAGLLLTPNACTVLNHLGLLDPLTERAMVTPAWEILDPHGRQLARVEPCGRGQRALSTRRSDLQETLRQALPAESLHLDHAVTSIAVATDDVTVRFENGATLRSGLVVAADGAGSTVRQALWPSRHLADQGYVGWRTLVLGVPAGWEGGRVTESWGCGQRFGIAAVGNGRTYWYASANSACAGPDDPARRREQLLAVFDGWHHPVQELIAATAPGAILRHPIADAGPERQWTAGGRLALLGDAAHPLTPNLGQGVAMALEDAWELARCLATAADVGDPAPALRDYERARRRRLTVVWATSRLMGRAIQSEVPGWTALRDMALRWTPPLLANHTLRWLYAFNPR